MNDHSPTAPPEAAALPVFAHCLHWHACGENDISWTDWYIDGMDVVPSDWDGEAPDEVVAVVRLSDAQAALDTLAAEVERKSEAIQRLWKERDEARAEVGRLTGELAEARSERDDLGRDCQAAFAALKAALPDVEAIRVAALEGAAKVCDKHSADRHDSHESTAIDNCADAIRELAARKPG